MVQLITIDSMDAAVLHGNLGHTPHNQLRRIIGRFTDVYRQMDMGTAKDAAGKYWDWRTKEDGTIHVVEAS